VVHASSTTATAPLLERFARRSPGPAAVASPRRRKAQAQAQVQASRPAASSFGCS